MEESTELKVNDGYGYGYGFGQDRMAQWSQQETRDFIAMRAKFEQSFVHTKRNKNLWELVASKMADMGYRRTSDQCKCKWKNLVARYKETSPEIDVGSRQCPFFDELHALFTDKAGKRSQIDQSEEGICGKRKNRGAVKMAEEWSEEEEDEEEGSQEVVGMAKKKKSVDKDRLRVTAEKSRANSMHEILEDFFKQQQLIEIQWRESVEYREAERREREREWRDTMERLEKERLLMERAWRDRDEQRRARQDARADNRDALLAALLTKLIRPDM